MTDPRKPIFDAVRPLARTGLFNDPGNVLALDNLLDAFGVPRAGQAAKPPINEPRWMAVARALMGTAEIPGPKHNPFIVAAWKRLGAGWFTDDETPWCGLFVAHCIAEAGLPYPKAFPRAASWADWGRDCPPAVGAVVVFQRSGGGHVGFLVGESPANYYVLGGNQGNAVNITPIAKNRKVAIRWPKEVSFPAPGLPRMSGGTISVNEA